MDDFWEYVLNDLENMEYRNIKRPMYPFDMEVKELKLKIYRL